VGLKGLSTMRHKKQLAGALVLLLLMAGSARADGIAQMERLIGKADSQQTQKQSPAAVTSLDPDAIRLTPDRTKILRLKQDAASVIVTNPQHAVVMLDSPRLLILMPRDPGTTSFTVLDRDGKVLMERNIIVSGAQAKYVRIRRVCGNNNNCVSSAYYYCPDGCYEITPVDGTGQMAVPAVAGGTAPPRPTGAGNDPMIDEEYERDMTADDAQAIHEAQGMHQEQIETMENAVEQIQETIQNTAPPAVLERMEGQ
jgi:hypothetical protein